jgi:hypothetical protein
MPRPVLKGEFMNNKETKEWLLKWVKEPHGIFSWPTDACGYDQHIKFVDHRNKNWKGGDFNQFVIDYANSLTEEK